MFAKMFLIYSVIVILIYELGELKQYTRVQSGAETLGNNLRKSDKFDLYYAYRYGLSDRTSQQLTTARGETWLAYFIRLSNRGRALRRDVGGKES